MSRGWIKNRPLAMLMLAVVIAAAMAVAVRSAGPTLAYDDVKAALQAAGLPFTEQDADSQARASSARYLLVEGAVAKVSVYRNWIETVFAAPDPDKYDESTSDHRISKTTFVDYIGERHVFKAHNVMVVVTGPDKAVVQRVLAALEPLRVSSRQGR